MRTEARLARMFWIITVCLLRVKLVTAMCKLPFMSVGDWGTVNDNSTAVGEQMGIYAEINDVNFVLSLGDHFYDRGVANDTDPQWDDTFHTLFPATSLDKMWYAVLGNHDYLGSTQAQVDYDLNDRDNRWYMPNNFYDVKIDVPAENEDCLGNLFTAHFIFLDTQVLAPYAHYLGDLPEDIDEQTSAHKVWLEDTLANSNSDWIIISGHYHIYTVGLDSIYQDLASYLIPLFQAYSVDAYISGHEHNIQHLTTIPSTSSSVSGSDDKDDKDDSGNNYGIDDDNDNDDDVDSEGSPRMVASTQLFVNGNTCRGDPIPFTEQIADGEGTLFERKYAVEDPGFMTHYMSANTLRTTAIDRYGEVIYSYTQVRNLKGEEVSGVPSFARIDHHIANNPTLNPSFARIDGHIMHPL